MIDGFTKNNNLNARNYSDTLQYTLNTGENPLDAYRLKIDYEKSLGIGKLTFGYQYRNQLQKGKFNYFDQSEVVAIHELVDKNVLELNKLIKSLQPQSES
jgi:hypothetical protein